MNYERIKHILTSGNIVKKFNRKVYKKILEKPVGILFYRLPVKKNRIVFDNFGGRGYGDNPKYVADKLISMDRDYELFWLVDNLSSYSFPNKIKPIKIDSIKGLYIRATSKLWVDNVRHLHPVKKKDTQIYLQVWHGPFGIKKVEADAEEQLGVEYVTQAKYDGQILDAIVSDSKIQDNQFKRAFWLGGQAEILKTGLPRNDFIAQRANDIEEYQKIRDQLNFNPDIFYVLYAPTFRDDNSTDGYQIDFNAIIKEFSNKLNKKVKMVIRLHPNVAFQCDFIEYDSDLINGTIYPDMQELLLACDALITDYSSTVFDFTILRKPSFICALDVEQYDKIRGLMPEFYSLPFPVATTNEQMIMNIKTFDINDYFYKLDEYFKKFPIYDDGHATDKVVSWIINKMR